MNKLLFTLICFICLNFSFQYDICNTLSSNCGAYSSKYISGCYWSTSPSKCLEAEYDSGCKINGNGVCTEANEDADDYECHFVNFDSNQRCKKIIIDDDCHLNGLNCEANTDIDETKTCKYTDSYYNHCQKITKKCDIFSDKNCGGLKKYTETKQCDHFGSETYCREIDVDNYCYHDGTQCTKRSRVTDDNLGQGYICGYEYDSTGRVTQCHRRQKICRDQDTSSCESFGNNCHTVNVYGYNTCKVVTVNAQCQIKNGDCTEADKSTIAAYENCAFDEKYENCRPENKKCEELTPSDSVTCSRGKIKNSGLTCSKVDGFSKCKEVEIHSSCQIDNDGKCVIKSSDETTNNECRFTDNTKTKCQYYKVDKKCTLGNDFSCTGEDTENKKICHNPDNDKTNCQLRNKNCGDYKTQSTCDDETVLKTDTTKCSWNSYVGDGQSKCVQYTIAAPCTVTQGVCLLSGTQTENKVCLFDNSNSLHCSEKDDTCTSYYGYNQCNGKSTKDNTKKCIYIKDQENCKEITVHEKCDVNENGCVNGKNLADSEKCALDSTQSSCTVTTKTCKDYSDPSKCSSLSNCYFIKELDSYNSNFNKCYIVETDNYCQIKDGECKPKDENSVSDYQECELTNDKDNDKATCKRRDKLCSEIKESLCNDYPMKSGNKYQCYYYNSACQNVTLDGKCSMNNNKCSKNSNVNLGDDEICDDIKTKYGDYYSHYYCGVRDKVCSDFTTSADCNKYITESPLCFNIEGNCKSVELDSQCKIEDSKCIGSGCSFDTAKTKCSYKSNGVFLKLKKIIIFGLFFLF